MFWPVFLCILKAPQNFLSSSCDSRSSLYLSVFSTFSQQHLIPIISNGAFPPPHCLTIYHSDTQPDQKPAHTANKQAQNLK